MTNPPISAIFVAAVAVWAPSAAGEPAVPPAMETALQALSGTAIRAHMTVLADDGLEGREAGTEGYRQAAAYVAARFAEYGLEPWGDAGTYYQGVPFLETRLQPGSAALVLHQGGNDVALEFGADFVRSGGFGTTVEGVTAPLVFVGYGIRAPEYGHDDYAGIDAAGRLLVVLTGAPPRFATDERAFYSSHTGKRALAVEHGAVGLLAVRTPVDQERLPWTRYQSGIGSATMRWVGSDGAPHEGFAELTGDAVLSNSGAGRLFDLAGIDLEALFKKHGRGETGSFELGVSATLRRRSEQRRVQAPNVLGMVRGSDPRLADEVLLYTAHLDHLGIRPGTGDDDIHNGAYDNAAGVAAVLEIARAVGEMDPAPRRSIVFAALTGEEKGLQGSDYLAHHLSIAIDKVIANINIDMPYLGFPVADIEGLGVDHSSLVHALRRATDHLRMGLTPDPRPELVRLIRSDQYSFVKQGVPGLNFKAGSRSSDPEIDGAAMRADFLQNHYHRPSDDLALPYSPEGAERFVRAALLMGLIVADDDERPRWNEGDFFGRRFARHPGRRLRQAAVSANDR